MGFPENQRVFHPDCRKVIDIKESPVIYFLGSHTPLREPVDLLIKEIIKKIKAFGLTCYSIKYIYIFIYECLNPMIFTVEIPQSFLYDFFFPVSFCNFFPDPFLYMRVNGLMP